MKEKLETKKLLDTIIYGMQEKKAQDIICLDLAEIPNAVARYFVVCHGDSNRQVEAIADSVIDETIKVLKEKPSHKEGFQNAEWILLDYFDIVANVFYKEKRDFYDLEGLWADAKKITISE